MRPTAGLCFKQTRLKGTEAKTEVGMKTQKICEYFHLHDSVCCSIKVLINASTVLKKCFEFEPLRAQPSLLALYKKQKQKAEKDGLLTFATYSGFVNRVADTDCWV